MTKDFRIEALTSIHDRKTFASGVEPLDRYLREIVTQDVKRRVSNCFVAVDRGGTLAGYYTLAAASLPVSEIGEDLAKRLPRYPVVPAALVGRLAVDHRFRGQGLGSALVIDAVARAVGAAPAVFALIVDAKDDESAAFYRHLGFSSFESRPASLFLPIATALQALSAP